MAQAVRFVLQSSLAAAYATGAIAAAPQAVLSASRPPLPTPCAGVACNNGGGALNFVQSGVAAAVSTGNNLTVNQSSSKAILNWKDFNVAGGYSVTFNQPNSLAATLNRIWSADPSVIAGKLTANGQVYLINQNGIVFANGAQVNVAGLTASTLNLSDNAFQNGLLSQNSSTLSQGANYVPAVFDASLNPSGQAGEVKVEAGAQLTTNASGGRIMLLGESVTNQGRITTTDGQAILAAGTKVYLASTSDPTMRGLLVQVNGGGSSGASASSVTNAGEISAPRGNVTLAGLAVNQEGIVSATSSVNANGSIYLVAGDTSQPSPDGSSPGFYNNAVTGYDVASGKSAESRGQMLPNYGGTLTLAAGSVTQITADATDTATITDSQSFYSSQVNLVGKNINLVGNATVRAPGATVNAVAAANPFNYAQRQLTHQLSAQPDGSRIYLDSRSVIDVSGLTDVEIAATRNLIPIRLGANELADDPLQRDGFLHGQTVTVDVTRGSTLLNAATLASYRNTIGRGIQEKLTAAGTIQLGSSGDVITRAGSIQNVSGGSIAYQSAMGQATSKLVGADGKVYDVTTAPTDIQYVGFADRYSYTDPRWGTVTASNQSANTLIPGYLQGANAGELIVQAPQIYLRGTMLGQTTPGIYQRSGASLPQTGTFVLGDSAALPDPANNAELNRDAPAILLQEGARDTLGTFDPATSTLPGAGSTVISLANLAASGFGNIALYSNGSITQPASSQVTLPGNGSLTLDGRSIALDGQIRAPGSTVNLVSE
ncbi:MAG TPA: filamentous hemagglutinin N-terminal domain-containing protein, partial [Steroidobacteraceae bacterium]|nr:filamentous hemagglutinin N-terminal domain-containing protein [Steroidobacteraceae bacterium]